MGASGEYGARKVPPEEHTSLIAKGISRFECPLGLHPLFDSFSSSPEQELSPSQESML